jgi:hypothetical protein
MIRSLLAICLLAAFVVPTARAADKVTDVEPLKQLDPAHMKAVAEAVGAKPGETKGKVHTITLPREDLDVSTPDLGDVPVEAGLASTFRFWRCTCGKYYMVGEFVVADYEANDVIDSLRTGAHVYVASVAPILLQEKPRLLSVRFQGEGDIETLTKVLKDAVRWTGANRLKANPVKKE